MYRPNRIGPYVLWARDQLAEGDNYTADTGSLANVYPKLHTATPIEDQGSIRMYDLVVTLPAGQQVAVGIPFNGALKADLPTTYSFCGSALCWANSNAVTTRPYIARANSGTLVTLKTANVNISNNLFHLPSQNDQTTDEAGNFTTVCSVNTSVLVGQFNGGAVTTSPIIFGFQYVNRTADSVSLAIDASMSGQRYIEDIDSYDVSR